jgi:hypothetical protein
MQYVLSGIINFMAMGLKKNKYVYYILLIFLWILSSFNIEIADKSNYYYDYLIASYNYGFTNTEFGFQILCKFANYLGISFQVFLGIYFFIGLLLISKTILKFTRNSGYVLGLYFIYPFIIDVAQIRNFMAMSITIYAIPYLASNKKKDFVKYLILQILAISFHYSAVFYLSFLLIKKFNIKQIIKIVTTITVLGSIFNALLPTYIVNIFPFLEQKMHRYTQSGVSIYTKIGMLTYLSVGMILVYIAWRSLHQNNKRLKTLEMTNMENKDKKMELYDKFPLGVADVILKVNIIMFIIYPFLFYAYEYIRVYRNILILNYILFANVISFRKKTLLKDFVYRIAILFFVTASFWYFIYYQFSNTVFFPLFQNNYFFSY